MQDPKVEPGPTSRGDQSSYDTLLELGRGGMGSALLARAMGLGGFERLVVIKRLRPEYANDDRAVQRFVAEARIAASIHHANVVATQHVDVDAEGPYLVLDYVEGATLEELLDRSMLKGGPVPAPICLRIALDVLSGLDAVHEARDSRGRPLCILHRDLSLQNVLLGLDGVTRVSDFGIAKSAFGSALTEEGYMVGKLMYLPPEYLRRESVGPTMDVYSLGVTLWLVLTGGEPWPRASEAQLMQAIINEGLPPPSFLGPIAPAIEQLVLRACARLAGARFPSARAMADEIERIHSETGWMASHREVAEWVKGLVLVDLERRRQIVAELLSRRGAKPSPPESRSSSRRLRTAALLLSALALAALVLAAVLFARPTPSGDGPSPTAPLQRFPGESANGDPPLPAVTLGTPEMAPTSLVSSPSPSAEPAPSRERVRPPVVRQAASARARSKAVPAIDPARAPDEIKAKNPYLR